MRACHRIAALITAVSVCWSPVAAQPVQPSGKWTVDYATTQCTASREFASPESTTELGIIPMPNEEGYEIIILGTGRGPDPAIEFRVLVGIGTNSQKRWVINYKVPPTKSAYRFHLSAQDMEQLRSTRYLWLRIPDSPPIVDLKLGSIDGVLKALHACVLDLKRYWNADGVPGGQIATVAHGDLRSIFKSTDYPTEALDRNQEGSATYLLVIIPLKHVRGSAI